MSGLGTLRKLLVQTSGLTLVEIVVALGILSIIGVMVTNGTFQIVRIQGTWRAEVIATKDLRHAGSYFAGDVMNAVTTTPVAGASATTTVTLHWTDTSNTFHTAKYSRHQYALRAAQGARRRLAGDGPRGGSSRLLPFGRHHRLRSDCPVVRGLDEERLSEYVYEEQQLRLRMIGRQEGQALVIVLAFMVLAIPMITGALSLATSVTIDSQVKTRILKSHYSGLGAHEQALHQLVAGGGATTTSITLNGTTITTTVDKLASPPRDLPIYALQGTLETSKTASPTAVSSTATTTYTITVTNKKSAAVTVQSIYDELPTGFYYVTGTSIMKDSGGTVISTADPSKQINQLVWSVPASTTLEPDASMTMSFTATTPETAGIYCNEAWVYPGGQDSSSGKEAEVTVGSTSETGCKGGVVEVTKTVDPAMVSSNTTTTYTFVIKIVNKGDVAVNILEIKDITSDGFTYVLGSTSSTPASVAPGEPITDILKNEITWAFEGVGKELATGTTWLIQFKTTATLTRGFYPNVVEMQFAGASPSPWQEQFCEFGDESLTISQGESFDCPIGSNGDITIDQQAVIAGGAMSLNGDIVLGQQGVVGSATVDGNLMALGGDIIINQQTTVYGDIIAAGNVTFAQQIVVKGNVIVGGDFTLDQQVTIEGYIWAAGNVTIAQQVNFQGDIISGGDIILEQQSTIAGSIYAVGSVTVAQQVAHGTIYANSTSIPSYPPIPLSPYRPSVYWDHRHSCRHRHLQDNHE